MLSKLLLAAFVSISLRTANIPDQPVDYEYAGGIRSKTTEISGYRERENGVVYDGFNYRKSEKYFYSDIIYKEAQGFDSQSFALKYPVENWAIGAGLNSQKWNNGKPMVMLEYSNDVVKVMYQLATSRQIIDSKISQEIPLKGNFYIEPLATYHYELLGNEKNDYWQAKILIGYKFRP